MRILFDGFPQAGRELRANPFRALLTLLGITFGVASLIAMVGVMESMVQGMQAFNDARGGLHKISVNKQAVPTNQQHRAGLSPGRTMRDAEALELQAKLVHHISPFVEVGWRPIHHGKSHDWFNVQGITPQAAYINTYEVQKGRFISDLDVDLVAAVCVISDGMSKHLFAPGETIIGTKIVIENNPYTIIGILRRYESKVGGRNALWLNNWSVWIPISTAQKRHTFRRTIDKLEMHAINLPEMAQAMEEVTNIVRPLHRGVADFVVENQIETMQDFAAQQTRLRVALGIVAGISLIIGGIGIMGIMLAGVNERIQEIGVRMALGARPSDVFAQFIFEATILGIAGGVTGLAAGAGLVELLDALIPDQNPVLVPWALALGGIASTITGLFAGLYPALRAARLNPITALHYE